MSFHARSSAVIGTLGRPLAALALGAFVIAAPASAAVNVYMKIDTIPGISTSALHPNEIEVMSFSEGVAVSGAPGKAKFDCSNLSFMKVLDNTSPKLIQAVFTGQTIPNAKLSYTRPSGAIEVDYFTIQLTSVTVTSDQLSGSNENPTESVSLAAKGMTVTFIPQTGSPISTTISCP